MRAREIAVLRAMALRGGVATRLEMIMDTGGRESWVTAALDGLSEAGVLLPGPRRGRGRGSGRRGCERSWRIAAWPDWAGRRPAARPVDPRYQPKRRRCLSCGEAFDSQWCGHRRCDPCARACAACGEEAVAP